MSQKFMEKKTTKNKLLALIAVLFLVALDQVTKYLAVVFLKGREAVVLIKGVLELRYLENRSAAFGMDLFSWIQEIFQIPYFVQNPEAFLLCKMVLFVILTVAILFLIARIYLRLPAVRRFFYLDLVLIFFFAGAVGNCIDRMFHRYVIDFIYFSLIDFPIFNVADIYVTVTVFVMIGLGLFYYKEKDFEIIFPTKSKG